MLSLGVQAYSLSFSLDWTINVFVAESMAQAFILAQTFLLKSLMQLEMKEQLVKVSTQVIKAEREDTLTYLHFKRR